MEAPGPDEPVGEVSEGQDVEEVSEGQGGQNDVSEDSDSGEVIIELDQNQIASPSDSEDGELHPSPEKPDTLYNRTAESEYFDAVSDLEDMPDDEAKPSGEPITHLETEPMVELAADSGEINQDGKETQESASLPDHPQGPTSAQISSPDKVIMPASGESITHTHVTTVPDSCTEATSETAGEGDSKVLQLEQADVLFSKDDSSIEKPLSPEADPSSLFKEQLSIGEPTDTPMEDVPVAKDSATLKEVVSSATDMPEVADPATENEPPAVVTGNADLTTGADDMSDVSSEGEAPLSSIVDDDDEDKPSVEKLYQEAAHQAEALAPLGAEPVSEPESGEDMGSDESCPASPGFDSPAIMTSSSTLSRGRGDYGNVHTRITPTKSDSSIVLDSSSAARPAERLSLDAAIPTVSSISGSKLDLSASLDMENISDDENIGEDNDSDTSGEIEDDPDTRKVEEPVTSSTNPPEEEAPKDTSPGEKTVNGERVRRPIMIASLGDKQQVQTHFNEEQVELDYEDVDGDGEVDGNDGEIKPEDEDEKEEGEDSDRDEGELDDDDDCEEGEIKEPGGTKKPFTKATCRFFLRGACTWGLNCRFLHPGVNDKGNYQMIELPGQRWNGPPGLLGPAPWGSEPQEEAIDLPPPPEVPPAESAWERGLRYAKEQMKKASQRKEQESNFEEKRLNLSVDEEREMNKENERRMVVHPIPKDPYYDQAAYDEEEYYKPPGINPWQTGRYENFEVRYNREMSYSPYRINREKEYYPPPPERYPRHFSPPVDKFGRHPRDDERPEPPYRNNRMEDVRARTPPPPAEAAAGGAPSFPSRRPADEWHDPWRRSKSPKANRRGRSRSRSRRGRRSVSDSTISSKKKKEKIQPAPPGVKTRSSRSRSRSSGSHSSRSFSRSSISSRSRSRSPEPAPPGVERGAERGMDRGGIDRGGMDRGGMDRSGGMDRGGMDRGGMDRGDRSDRNYGGPQGRYMDGPRSAVSVRGRGGGGGDRGGGGGNQWRNQDNRQGYHNNRTNNYNSRAGGGNNPQRSQQQHHHHRQRSFPGQQDQPQERSFPPGYGYNRPQQGRSRQQERRIPADAMRPKTKAHSASSSGSSRSRSHSGSRSGSSSSYSRSRSGSARSRSASSVSRSRSRSASSISSRTSSSSSHSSGSADSDNLYRDLGGPSPKKKTVKEKDKDVAPGTIKAPLPPGQARVEEKDKDMATGTKAPIPPGQARVSGSDRKRRADQMAHRPSGPPLPPGAPSADRPGRPMRPEGRPERPPMERPDQSNRVGHPGRPDRPSKPDRAERPDRPMRPERQERPDRAERIDRVDRPDRLDRSDRLDRPDRLDRADRAERLDRPERPAERPERPERPDRPGERPDRPERMGDRPERMDRMDRSDRERDEIRQERPDRAERERAMVAGRPAREQSSRPPPPSQSKAKDPMKTMGLKSNIKLSLISKQPSEKPGSAMPSSPLKRRPTEAGDGPPSKRPAMPTSPVKMPSEKAAKPSAGRERAKSPSERQPRSATMATNPASLPLAAAAGSIPLPPTSPTKAIPPTAPSKPRPPSTKTAHPPSAQAGSKPAAAPAPVPPPVGVPPPAPVGVSPAGAQAAAAKVKKSTTSRREELLKQLKAVEDAIARKKAKMQ